MAEVQPLAPEILLHIAQDLNIPLTGVRAVMALLDEGSTVPFIARYRKEATGNLDEVQIRDIAEKIVYFREFISRRETVLASITEQGKMTDELKAKIMGTLDRSELEDL
ncbi:MAG: Tex-like N-terminal domain-containing protein, partial [Terriglobus sp.]